MWCSVKSQPRQSGWSGGHLICQQGWTELGALHVCWLCLTALSPSRWQLPRAAAPSPPSIITAAFVTSTENAFPGESREQMLIHWVGWCGDRACQSEFVTGETGEAGASANTARPAESGQQFSGNGVYPMADNSTGTRAPSTESPSGCGPWQRWGAAMKGPDTQYHWKQCYTEFSHPLPDFLSSGHSVLPNTKPSWPGHSLLLHGRREQQHRTEVRKG